MFRIYINIYIFLIFPLSLSACLLNNNWLSTIVPESESEFPLSIFALQAADSEQTV